jgi:hypothetical protein
LFQVFSNCFKFLQRAATSRNELQLLSNFCNFLQRRATFCNVAQLSATKVNKSAKCSLSQIPRQTAGADWADRVAVQPEIEQIPRQTAGADWADRVAAGADWADRVAVQPEIEQIPRQTAGADWADRVAVQPDSSVISGKQQIQPGLPESSWAATFCNVVQVSATFVKLAQLSSNCCNFCQIGATFVKLLQLLSNWRNFRQTAATFVKFLQRGATFLSVILGFHPIPIKGRHRSSSKKAAFIYQTCLGYQVSLSGTSFSLRGTTWVVGLVNGSLEELTGG